MRLMSEGRLNEAKRQFDARGFCVLEHFFSTDEIAILREECDAVVGGFHRGEAGMAPTAGDVARHGCVYEVVRGGGNEGVAECDRDAFSMHRSTAPLLGNARDIVLKESLVGFAKRMLGSDTLFYFNEQYIVKPPMSSGSGFKWHRDSDWCSQGIHNYHRYLSIWCALDDVHEENGTIYTKGDGDGNGDDDSDGVPLVADAGTIIVMSDQVLHRSSPNIGDTVRRAWMPQFSAGRIAWKESDKPVAFAIQM